MAGVDSRFPEPEKSKIIWIYLINQLDKLRD